MEMKKFGPKEGATPMMMVVFMDFRLRYRDLTVGNVRVIDLKYNV